MTNNEKNYQRMNDHIQNDQRSERKKSGTISLESLCCNS